MGRIKNTPTRNAADATACSPASTPTDFTPPPAPPTAVPSIPASQASSSLPTTITGTPTKRDRSEAKARELKKMLAKYSPEILAEALSKEECDMAAKLSNAALTMLQRQKTKLKKLEKKKKHAEKKIALVQGAFAEFLEERPKE